MRSSCGVPILIKQTRLFNLAEFEYLFAHVNNNVQWAQSTRACAYVCGSGQIRESKAQQKSDAGESVTDARASRYDEYLPGIHRDSHSVGECH